MPQSHNHKNNPLLQNRGPSLNKPIMGAERKWLFTLFSAVFLSLLLLLFTSFSTFISSKPYPSIINRGPHYPPSFAYYISGGHGQADQIFRLFLAVYHPRNRYLLHLSADATHAERTKLVAAVRAVPAVRSFANVDVIGKPDPITYMGSTNVAAALHGAAILLKLDGDWDWFITLSAMDYPLIAQDDLFHVFSLFSRDVNFIDHTGDLGWKEDHRIKPIIVDPGIYLARRTQTFQATQKRPTPDAFKVFTGSAWVILSRQFLEYCVFGWDNLPRTLLMYFNNVMLSQEGYFHTVICNSPDFKNTSVNSDLRFMIWDNPPEMEPLYLNTSDFKQMVHSGAAFARQFKENDPVLDLVDEKILKRGRGRATAGAWCTGRSSWFMDPCSQWGDVNVLKPGPQAKILEDSVMNLIEDMKSQSNQCK